MYNFNEVANYILIVPHMLLIKPVFITYKVDNAKGSYLVADELSQERHISLCSRKQESWIIEFHIRPQSCNDTLASRLSPSTCKWYAYTYKYMASKTLNRLFKRLQKRQRQITQKSQLSCNWRLKQSSQHQHVVRRCIWKYFVSSAFAFQGTTNLQLA